LPDLREWNELNAEWYDRLGLGSVYAKALEGGRLTLEEGERLFACPDIHAVGSLARLARERLHGDKVHYVLNRHINYSNICVNDCLFCAFVRKEGEDGAFQRSMDEIVSGIAAEGHGLSEVHIVGGCHPELRLAFFLDLFKALKRGRPEVAVKGLTAVEVAHLAALEGMETKSVLQELHSAGLAMLAGGGAEIFAPATRRRLCPEKIDGQEWLRIAAEAHGLGMRSNATMLFGHVESIEDRLEHLDALRIQQDESGGFLCFIPLPYLPGNNRLQPLPERSGSQAGLDRLRTMAVSRLMLDNIPHLKAYWVMLGLKMAQLALHFGADDLDGPVRGERIGQMAGAPSPHEVSPADLESMISNAGFTPVRRNALFESSTETVPSPPIKVFPGGGLGEAPFLHNSAGERNWTSRFTDARRARARTARVKMVSPRKTSPRLSFDDSLRLYRDFDLFSLGRMAHEVRLAKNSDPVVTYIVDRNVNYTNICVSGCRFCAFHRSPESSEGWVLSREELDRKIEETLEVGGVQILLQGGLHPELPLSWYEELLRYVKSRHDIRLHAFSPPEIVHFSRLEGVAVDQVIARLRAAGLDSIPGGGAEILADAVRQEVSPHKCGVTEWLEVMEEAHRQGLRTTATMMFGHVESLEQRLEHLFALRELQDRTGGFTAFIPWPFQPTNTEIQRQPETAPAYLRLLALSRLVLDNFDHVQASWVTMGPEIAQAALFFGADDFGSVMLEENVVAAAGVRFRMAEEEIQAVIRGAGFSPRRRNMNYTLI
jgi:aminodeoxyfutalosine synthase